MKMKKNTMYIYLIPILVILCFQPLFLRVFELNTGLEQYAWSAESSESMDLFLYGKMVLFEIVCITCIIMLLIYLFNKNFKIELPKVFLLLVGYTVLALASTLLSQYRQFGFSGITEQYESVWCLLGYVLVIVYIYILLQDLKYIYILLYGLLLASLVIGIIGFSQFIGHDLLLSGIAKSMYSKR